VGVSADSDNKRANLKKKKKQREELSAERLRELSTTVRTQPFDERRRPPPKKKFSEVDNTDPAFDFEQVPATMGSGKKGRRPVSAVGNDYEDFGGGASAALIEAPPPRSGQLTADDLEEVEEEKEAAATTTIPPLEQEQFDAIREKFEAARKEITTEFSRFNNRPPVEGGSYASMTMGVQGPAAAQATVGRGKALSSGQEGRHERPSSASESPTSSAAPSHKDVFNFSLPEEPPFPSSLEAVIHHNPFRHNFEQLNASRTAASSGIGRMVTTFSAKCNFHKSFNNITIFAQRFYANCHKKFRTFTFFSKFLRIN
jgi:hypothetical protein